MRVQKLIQGGMTEEEAEVLAHKQFGNIDTVKHGMRQARSRHWRMLGAAVTGGVIVIVGLWIYDLSRPANLPRPPRGMEFIGGPPSPP